MIRLPRIGIVPNCTPGLDDLDDPHTVDFDGWSLVIVWGRFSFEIFMGKRA
jgi:hypothetical protein